MTVFLFWFSLALIILSYLAYPLILILLSAVIKRSFAKEGMEQSVTLIIPAHNEESVIGEKIKNVFSLDYAKGKMEILLILDGCTDKTKTIAEKFSGERIKIIEQNPRKGKMAALNLAVSQARGEIVVFTDADVILDTQAIKYLVENFKDKKIGCVGGELIYVSSGESLVEAGENLYFKYDKFLRDKESKMGTLLVVSGSIYAMRKSLFVPIREDLADDFINPISVASKGFWVVCDSRAKAFGKVAKTTKDEFGQKTRVVTQGFKASAQIFRFISNKNYIYFLEFIFHKFLRWIVPLFLMGVFISNLLLWDLRNYKIVFCAQLIFYAFAAVGYFLQKKRIDSKIFYIPFYFTLINIAALIGLIKFLIGEETKTWELAQTTRK
ncbi:MAG: glycosyltransferase family 2 protein [Candidatus Omnitrophota bacterium]